MCRYYDIILRRNGKIFSFLLLFALEFDRFPFDVQNSIAKLNTDSDFNREFIISHATILKIIQISSKIGWKSIYIKPILRQFKTCRFSWNRYTDTHTSRYKIHISFDWIVFSKGLFNTVVFFLILKMFVLVSQIMFNRDLIRWLLTAHQKRLENILFFFFFSFQKNLISCNHRGTWSSCWKQ